LEGGVTLPEKVTKNRGRKRKSSNRRQPSLRFIPLGGLGEIGKNMFILEYGEDILVVDSGLMFPDEEMLGIDFVIPDISYLVENRDRIRGVIITHGHEDHIGALPFVLPKLDVPVYGTRLTMGMVRKKMEDASTSYSPLLNEVQAGDTVSAGVFNVRFFPVCHSIPDGVGLKIETPLGLVVHTGDIKLDPTPVDGRLTDYAVFSEAGEKGVLLMLSDSTNVERKGFTPSEKIVGRTVDNIFSQNRNRRIIIAAFASNLHRVQQVINTTAKFNRKIAFLGRSMVANIQLAKELGYLEVDDRMIISPGEAETLPPNKVVVMTTGSQGEPFSGLVLMSRGQHRNITLGPKDLVAVFATPIPGNERLVSNTVNRLFSCGCDVIYEKDREIHVSGHASREELKMLLNMVKPKYFVPVHGEYRHLVRHAQLAQEVGIPARNTFVLEKGDVLSITSRQARVKSRVQAGAVLVDGIALGELEGSAMRERRDLSEEGMVVISVCINESGRLISSPLFESKGFIHIEEASVLKSEMTQMVHKVVKDFSRKRSGDMEILKSRLRSGSREVIRKYSPSKPLVIPLINVISSSK
jgi:ribonuclease J